MIWYKKIALTLALATAVSIPLRAQDPVTTDPRHFKLEFEDERVRVIRLRLAPGESTLPHAHSARISVALSAGKLRITEQGGETHDIEVSAGSVERLPATRHTTTNIGDHLFEEINTEFKDVDSQPAPLSTSETNVTTQPSQPRSKERPATAATVAPPPVSTVRPPATTTEPAPPAAERTGRASRRAVGPNPFNTVNVNGTQLAFIEQGSGTPVVLVHPALGDYRTWTAQLARFAKRYHVISYSRRYHYPNLSTGKESDYSYEQNAKDLSEFITALNLGPVHLIGHGYGAAISAMVAEQHPELVRSLVISEPGFDNLLDASRAYRSRYAREEIFNIIRKPLSKNDPEKGVQVYHDWLADTEPWAKLSAQEQYDRKQNANALRDQTNYPLAAAFTCDDAKKIKAPVLIVAGQTRSPNSAEITGVLSGCIPTNERATISNTGPAAYLDNSAEYNEAVEKFLAKH